MKLEFLGSVKVRQIPLVTPGSTVPSIPTPQALGSRLAERTFGSSAFEMLPGALLSTSLSVLN